ncbi:MAG: radical SAM family heme chaperone HemW [Parachlamydia sp.]|jgi:oxygen-independent coproporphyrinogen-3 oxidase|nr:radical SAM family heme chaperone HemW [Parachlamydia sp.]
MQTIGNLDHVSLYFHIPFCSKKCDYCHFYVLPDREPLKVQLYDSFLLEWEQKLPLLKDKEIISIYFGGGTPSLFGASRIGSLLNHIKESLPFESTIEVTLEANPESTSRELMAAYQDAGINRISIGMQTLDANLLQMLGRTHTPQRAITAIFDAYSAGIKNITVDLMYDLPGQSLETWKATLAQIQDLPVSHLSLYNLTIEPHTQFFKKQSELRPLLPPEEISLEMYKIAVAQLESYGLMQYEISAFAKPGCHSIHNTGYWTGRQFLGFGPSAFSYWDGRRFRNVSHLGKYAHALKGNTDPIDFEERLDPQAHLRELLVIALRLRQGLNLKDFESSHGSLAEETLQTMAQLEKKELLTSQGNNWTLTNQGVLLYDALAAELI